MEQWKSQSRLGRQIVAAIACAGVGLILAVGFHNFNGPGMTNSKAGFFLGLLLLIIGILGFVFQGSRLCWLTLQQSASPWKTELVSVRKDDSSDSMTSLK